MRPRPTIAELMAGGSMSFRQANAYLETLLAKGAPAAPAPRPATITRKSDEDRLNKLEKAFLAYLRALHPWVGIQCITLKLGWDCRYTCDLWTVKDGRFTGWETKGKWYTDDSKVKLHVAAKMYPDITFNLVRVDPSGGGWLIERVPQ